MSTPPPPPLPPPPHLSFSLHNLGLGYSIAIAFAFLLLLSTLLLSSYLCCRRRPPHAPPHSPSPSSVILPRIFFVAEDDDSSTPNGVVGLDRVVINSYPKFQFSKINVDNRSHDLESNNNNNNNNNMCSICLCEYKEGEMLRMMPDCRHYFHLYCLDAWLKLNGSCPVCRNSPLPTPVSTPLAEVMPLSLYPDNRRRSSVTSSS
ncbi:hypothetical protein RND81_03G214100 [Saponaria officinalis]|uniref:RING-type domain-containing protein n=1 Tax=Saponaria officinalis TaxID=3572 RepID=A0AAW1M985_SAPOF